MAKSRTEEMKAKNAESVTPSDTEDINYISNGIYVGEAGDLEVTLENMADGESVTFVGLSAGMIHPIRTKRIWAANTTATDIIAVY